MESINSFCGSVAYCNNIKGINLSEDGYVTILFEGDIKYIFKWNEKGNVYKKYSKTVHWEQFK